MDDIKLQIKSLSASYGEIQILRDIDLSVRNSEFVSILGPSGCGKSTLLNIISGLLEKDSGSVLVDGKEMKGVSEHFAYMPQKDLLFPWKTILENVTLYGSLHGKKKETTELAMANMKRFGLSGYEKSYPDQLSGGMSQRAAFLRTYLCSADIMLLDEPFAALDVITREEMQDWLNGLRKDFSRTTVLVTHDLNEAVYLSDRIYILTGRPATFSNIFEISEKSRTRDWLFDQEKLKKEIYHSLK